MVRKIAATLWWLGLSLYLGGMVALGIVVAPTLFKGVRELGAPLPGWIGADGPSQLGGELFGRLLLKFQTVEILCIILMAAGVMTSGWKLVQSKGLGWAQRLLLAIVGLIFIYDASILTPEVFKVRTEWRQAVANQSDPADIDAQHAHFDMLHKRAELVGHLKVWTLATLLIVSAVGMTAGTKKMATNE